MPYEVVDGTLLARIAAVAPVEYETAIHTGIVRLYAANSPSLKELVDDIDRRLRIPPGDLSCWITLRMVGEKAYLSVSVPMSRVADREEAGLKPMSADLFRMLVARDLKSREEEAARK